MIKATIQNSPYCTEICFPCSETELSDKLGELGMDKEHLSPMATVLEIEPAELSMLVDSEVSLDALNYLGKHMDGMSNAECNFFCFYRRSYATYRFSQRTVKFLKYLR